MRDGYRFRGSLMDGNEKLEPKGQKVVFYCNNRQEAYFKIRHELGENFKFDSREIKRRGKGFWGFLPWRKIKCIEVTAIESYEDNIIKDESSVKLLKNTKPTVDIEGLKFNFNDKMGSAGIDIIAETLKKNKVKKQENDIQNINKGSKFDIYLGANNKTKKENDVSLKNNLKTIQSNESGDKNDLISEQKDRFIIKESGAKMYREKLENVSKELKEVKEILKSFIEKKEQIVPVKNSIIDSILEQLCKSGMERIHIDVMKKAIENNLQIHQKNDREFIRDYMFKGLLKIVNVSEPLVPEENKMKCVALVGPTGVGKTTTLAKLATIFWHSYKCKVAFITIDTFRIGATDQLSKFGSIIGVPTKVAFNPDEAKKFIEEYKSHGYDLVLIDCFGFAPSDNDKMADLCRFFSKLPETQKILTLAANMKYEDLYDAVIRFKQTGCSDLIITHMDSTRTFGSLISLLGETKQSIMYTTHGQNVPGDIQEANLRHIIGRLIYKESSPFSEIIEPYTESFITRDQISDPVKSDFSISPVVTKEANKNKFAIINKSEYYPQENLNVEVMNKRDNYSNSSLGGVKLDAHGFPEFLVPSGNKKTPLLNEITKKESEKKIDSPIQNRDFCEKHSVSSVVFTDLLTSLESSFDNSDELSKLSMDSD
jgi:flagellar biosynthesis protein FlhF